MSRKEIFCYFRRSVGAGTTPLDRILYQDDVLTSYSEKEQFAIMKRFSDFGYLGSPLTRPELVQMRRTLESYKYQPGLLMLYSIWCVRDSVKMNNVLFCEVAEKIGHVHFVKEGLTLDHEEFTDLVTAEVRNDPVDPYMRENY